MAHLVEAIFPPKTNGERTPNHGGLEDDFPCQRSDFQVLAVSFFFGGVYVTYVFFFGGVLVTC